jgi:hypothetical protein
LRFVVGRRFWVGDEQADFEVVFGSDGIWKELLSKARNYLDTEIECESPVEGRYRVRDFWKSHLALESFRKQFVVEYKKFDRLMMTEGLIQKQQLVGEYYLGEGSDGDDLVSAED